MYDPREDSFLMLEAIEKLNPKGKLALDMGTGTGILALELSKRFEKVIASDVDEKALRHVKSLKISNIEVRESFLFEKIPESFDLIVFNPPYLPCSYEEDPELCCGRDCWLIKRFLEEAREHLTRNGKILLLLSSLTPLNLNHFPYRFDPVSSLHLPFEKLKVYLLVPTGKPK